MIHTFLSVSVLRGSDLSPRRGEAHEIMQSGVTATVPLVEITIRLRSGETRCSDLQYMDQYTVQKVVIGVFI